MKLTRSTALVLGAATLLSVSGLTARPKDPERHLKRMKQHLELTEAQVEKIRAIHKKHRPRHEELRRQMKSERQAIRTLVHAEATQRAALKSKLEGVARLKVERRLLWFDQHREVREVLTAAQRQKLREHMQKRHERRKRKGQRGRRGHKCDCG